MKNISRLPILSLALLLVTNALADVEPGFTLLLNGKNLDGWRTAKAKDAEDLAGKTEAHKGRFKIIDGVLTYDPSVKGDYYIETKKEFAKDVQIRLDFRPGAKCNNDFLIRGTKFDIVPGKKETEAVKEGEWQTLEIDIQGDKIEHRINGVTVRTSKTTGAATPFMLRAEVGVIEIKNIRMKE